MKKIITFIATAALAFATSGEICEKNGGNWTWHGDINQWQCNNLPLNQQSIQRLAQYEIDYLKEFEEIKKTAPKTIFKWIQPKNKKAACTIAVPGGEDDPTKDSSYKIFWDGECKDGYAFGLGREIEKANLTDAWQIAIYEKGMAQGYYVHHDILNNRLHEGESNYYGAASVVERYVEEKNGNIDITFVIGKMGGLPQEPDLTIGSSPFWNHTQAYRKEYPNFRYEYNDYKNNDIEIIDFNFQLVNKDNQRNGWGFEKNKNGTIVKGEYVNGKPNPSDLPLQYMNKADSIIKEIQEAYSKALQSQSLAQLVKKQYLRKICKDNVKVNFMDNAEYKEVCEDKAELKLQAKVDRKLEKLEKEKVAIIQKQQQEIAQQKQINIQNEQLRQQQAYQQEQLNIQRQQQQEQAKRQEQQDSSSAWNSIAQSLNGIGDSFNRAAYQNNQQQQNRQTNYQLQQISNGVNNLNSSSKLRPIVPNFY